MTTAAKIPEIAGDEKSGENIRHPPRVRLKTTDALETLNDSFIFHTSKSGLQALIPT